MNKFIKSIKVPLLITIFIEIILLVYATFLMPLSECKPGAHCSSNLEYFINVMPYTIPAIFVIVIIIHLITKFLRKK